MIKAGFIGALLYIAVTAVASQVNITGTITQNGGGPLKDVTVSLCGIKNLTATTDASGRFSLITPVETISSTAVKSVPVAFRIQQRELVITSTADIREGSIAMFSSGGAILFLKNFSGLLPGSLRLKLPLKASNISFLRVKINQYTGTIPLIKIGNDFYLKNSEPNSVQQVALSNRRMALSILDTLIASKTGYYNRRITLSSYTVNDTIISMDSLRNCNGTTLKTAGSCSNHKLLIGTAVSSNKLTNLAAQEFNYVTAENEMKWETIEPREGSFNFTPGDAIINWTQQNGMKVKGHTLVWHAQLPSWVSQARGRDRVLNIMKNHIEKVMEHFGNKIQAWDVVNEAFVGENDAGEGTVAMRKSVFYNEIGPDYVKLAFQIARDYADNHGMKDLKLYYNDASLEGNHNKTDFARKIIKKWIDEGTPIDGVGFETHLGPPNNLATAENLKGHMQFYADLGLDVLISEWDINLCGNKISKSEQLELYYQMTKVCVNQPRCVAITFWGINDQDSWLNTFNTAECNGANSQSLLFSNNQKKDTYYKVLDALNGK
jgi:endo-1,4-beta-xylanase